MVDTPKEPKQQTLDEQTLMWRCAWMFYRQDISIKDIADALGIGRGRASLLLKRAKETGMVTFGFNPPRAADLETRLIEKYGLSDVVVVHAAEGASDEELRGDVGGAAAAYLERYLERVTRPRSCIALACGRTLERMIEALTPQRFAGMKEGGNGAQEPGDEEAALKLFPLNVATTPQFVSYFPNQLVAMMQAKYNGADAYNLQVPRAAPDENVDTSEGKRAYLAKYGILEHFDDARDADVFVVGIGSVEDFNPGYVQELKSREVEVELLKKRTLGEINYQPFDDKRFLTDEDIPGILRGLFAVEIEDIRKASRDPNKRVIAVACGLKKLKVIRASLNRNLICYDVLMTDEGVARDLAEPD